MNRSQANVFSWNTFLFLEKVANFANCFIKMKQHLPLKQIKTQNTIDWDNRLVSNLLDILDNHPIYPKHKIPKFHGTLKYFFFHATQMQMAERGCGTEGGRVRATT